MVIENGNLNRTLSYNGVLSPKNIVHVASTVPGEILEVPVKVGDIVSADDPLYILDKENVERSVKNAKLSLEAAQYQVSSLSDQHDLAVKAFERTKALYQSESGAAVSKSQYEQAEVAASSAGVDSARVQLAQARIALESANDQLEDADLKSPIDGIVSALNVEAGQTIGAGQHIADVINMDQVYVDIQVAENVISNLNTGDKIMASIPAVSSAPVQGTVEWVSPAADLTTRLFPVRVSFENAEHTIKPGMFVNVDITILEASDSVIIPSTAILERTDGKIVYVNKDNTAEMRYVETGFDNGESTIVMSGLSAGEEIVVEGQQYIEDGSLLSVNGGE
jgi:RND family efflux transporter MFP subunit